MKEACGVFGVYAPGRKVANLTFDGLFALQHRGQESAGMAVSDGDTVTVVKDMGLVATVFDERKLSGLQGHLAIGHTRYSTHGASDWDGAQPVYRPVGRAGFALGHNGNLTNTTELAEKVGMFPGSIATDSDVVAELLAHAFPETGELAGALQAVLPIVEGAFSFVLMNTQKLFGVRDPYGFRPLCLGRLGPAEAPEGWVLASETPALSVIGATFVREIDPGELVVIDGDGVRSLTIPWLKEVSRRLCIFEFAYIARPDSKLYGREVHETRCRMGELLAAQAPAEADLVMGVPESGVPAAEGFARASGIPYGQGLVKNRYIGRTFIAPDPAGPRRRRAAQAQPAARDHRRASGWWWSTTPSCGARRSARSCACCARPGPPRCTCASPRRPGAGPASTASTPRRPTSCWRPTTPSRRSPRSSGRTRSPTSAWRTSRRPSAAGRRVLRRLLHRRLPDVRRPPRRRCCSPGPTSRRRSIKRSSPGSDASERP